MKTPKSTPASEKRKSGRRTGQGGAGPVQAVRPQRAAAMSGKVTLRDVADAAGVSPMTVSNLVTGRFSAMRPETRQRIETEIARLGYRPHSLARSLRLSKRSSIGMITFDDNPYYLADPFNNRVIAGLGNHLRANGYGLLLQGLSVASFKSSPLIRDIRTDGICILMSGSDRIRREIMDTMLALGQPLVVFQDNLRFSHADVCCIRQADRVGGRALGRAVLQAGARRLLVAAPETNWPAIVERIKGIKEAIREAGGSATLRVVSCGDAEYRDTQAAIAADIDANGIPDAILAGNDQMGIAAMKLMSARGIRVPDRIMITGFNAFDFWQYTDPVLTTVRSPAYELGARGGAEILNRLDTGAFSAPEIVLNVELQAGGTV